MGHKQNVVLYCDSCPGQNKNRAMLAMLQTFLQESKNIKTLKIVFFLPGHTYMLVDAVHATLERFTKKRIVWAPSEWDTIIANARTHPRPFEVIRLYHTDFGNWKRYGDECLPAKTRTMDGQIFQISRLRQAMFEKGKLSFQVNYFYNCLETNLEIQFASRRSQTDVVSIPVYRSMLSISALKLKDLRELCQKNVIPKKFHTEYYDLRSKASVRDSLPETDVEDSSETE
ncbi:hypothetical protein ILUMI_18128 [Ignelater luminosus]|uniref:DUF7869 domain-containing protein n=1 Tax=Ignelater luminosus TaxID=2038154 RepID=A0A8K0G6V2_IGNLU|nr:hypothetical protein ILUMI_18128 [Ignelater luminosus]